MYPTQDYASALTIIRYFPKGQAHTVQGLDEENEFLLVFDDGDFDKIG